MRASDFGVILSSSWSFLAKKSFVHSLTVDIVMMQSYSSTTNLSIDAFVDIDFDADFY